MKPQINTDEHGLNDLTFAINGCAMTILNTIGHGFHEKIYENALAVAFKKRKIKFDQQRQFTVRFENEDIGTFIPDFVIDDRIIVELKTIDKIGNNEKGQVLNYLKASDLKLGLILNFKNPKLDWQRIVL